MSGRIDRGRGPFTYSGTELEIFAGAINWKRYWAAVIGPFIGKSVLEVGAGVGANKEYLDDNTRKWVALEPDPFLAKQIVDRARYSGNGGSDVLIGTIRDLRLDLAFDTILYIDVLEHIEDDRAELEQAVRHLCVGGHIVVVAPALPGLFSCLDLAVGHYRRYTRSTLTALSPSCTRLVGCCYLDVAGMVASAANRWWFKASTPSAKQIAFWDNVLIPVSRVLDRAISYRIGKSIFAVWRKD
jgi:SAM-dependent methyltransferase